MAQSQAPIAGSSAQAFWKPSEDLTPRLRQIQRSLDSTPAPRLRISRVAQLDADLLDHELETILAAPMSKALQELRMPGGRSWEPELMALLRTAVLKMSIYDRGITYGSGLQNLKYRNERVRSPNQSSSAIDVDPSRAQRIGYVALLVLPSYLHARLRDRMLLSSWTDEPLPTSWYSFVNPKRIISVMTRPSSDSARRWRLELKRLAWETLNLAERLVAVATLANFLVFLYDGRYRTLVDRLLGMRLIYAHRSIKPNVSFEFLNRQLVWEAFTEFLLFLMPLISVRRLRTRFARLVSNWAARSKLLSMLISNLPLSVRTALKWEDPRPRVRSSTTSKGDKPQGPFGFLPPTTCPICYQTVNAPPTAIPTNPGHTDPDRGTSISSTTDGTSITDTSVKLPYIANCGWGCRYCYYCVVEKLAAAEEEGSESWTCLRCEQAVTAVQREVLALGVDQGEEAEGSDKAAPDQPSGKPQVEEKEEIDAVEEVESVGSEHDRWRS